MKKIFTLLSVAAFSVAFGQIQVSETITAFQGEVKQNATNNNLLADHSLQQHLDDTVPATASAVRCPDAINGWGRLFDLSEHGITSPFTVTGTSIATILWPNAVVTSQVYTVTGVAMGADDIPFDNMTDTGYYGSFVNTTGERTWQWENIEGFDTATINPGELFYVTFDGYWAPADDAAYTETFYPLYNEAGQTHSAYFGSPESECVADSNNPDLAVSFTSIGMVGTTDVANWHYMMKVTGETEDMGTIELGGNALSISPNPTTTELNIQLKDSKIAKVEVADVTGRVIPMKASLNGKVNVSNLSQGVYFLRVQDDKGVTRIQKFIKK